MGGNGSHGRNYLFVMTRRDFLRMVAATGAAAVMGTSPVQAMGKPSQGLVLPVALPYVVGGPPRWRWGRTMTRRVFLPVVMGRR